MCFYYENLIPPKKNLLPGWWYTYPSEKYESQLGLLFPIHGNIIQMFQTTNQFRLNDSPLCCSKWPLNLLVICKKKLKNSHFVIGLVEGKILTGNPWFLPSNWSGFPVKIFPSSNSMTHPHPIQIIQIIHKWWKIYRKPMGFSHHPILWSLWLETPQISGHQSRCPFFASAAASRSFGPKPSNAFAPLRQTHLPCRNITGIVRTHVVTIHPHTKKFMMLK